MQKKTQVRLGLWMAAGMAIGAVLYAHEAHKHEEAKAAATPPSDAITVTGEVLDLSCYLGHGAKGKGHQKCAKKCLVELRVPAGLLTADGQVYLLVPDHDHEKAFKPIPKLAAEQIKVTGRKVLMGGLQGIMVEKAEKV